MQREELYNIDFVKQKLNEYLKNGVKPELYIWKINEYMIIPLEDKISFQWLGKTNEFYYKSVEELFK